MINGGRLLMCILSVFVPGSATRVIAIESSGGTPYQGIVERNVFGLKAPPPPPRPEDNKPPPPKITLQGITTILGNKRALMKVSMPARPPEPAKEIPLIMAEGQRDGEITVLEIDAKAGIVKVDDFGTIMSLDFTNNGLKTASTPMPGMPLGAPGFVPAPAARPFVPGAGATPLPTARPMRLPAAGGAAMPAGYGSAVAPASYNATPASATYTAVPAAATYGSTPAVVAGGGVAGTLALPGLASAPSPGGRQQNWPPETPMTPEQQTIMEKLYSTQYAEQIKNGTMPAIPGGNPLDEVETPPSQTTPPKNTAPILPLPPGAAHPVPY